MKTRQTGVLALGGVLTALAVVCLLLTVSPLATVGLAAVAGVCGIPIVIEWGRKAGLVHVAAVALLAWLMIPTVEGKMLYTAFFGWYTVFKGYIESKMLPRAAEWSAKIGAFVVAVAAYGAVWVFLLQMALPTGFTAWMIPVAAVVLCAVFVVYDLGLTRLIGIYCGTIRPKLRQLFRF